MPADPFVHLHVHTEYSMLDGAAKVGALFAEAQRLGMPAVAMTDHGNMFGADEFYQQAKKAGIKPIIGIEAYIAPYSRFHKKPVFWGEAKQRATDEYGEGGDVSGGGAYTHMTMLAANATGLRNLFVLSSLASFDGYYRKPRCLLPGQEIVTRDGMKRIEDVQVGDEVLTHRGRFRRVTEVMRNFHEGDIYGIRLNSGYGRVTWMTGEHPVLIRHRDGTKSWVEAKEIAAGRPGTGKREELSYSNSSVCLPRVRPEALVTSIRAESYVDWAPVDGKRDLFFKPVERAGMGPTKQYATLQSTIELDYDFGFFLGLYAAEGHVDRGHTVSWYFHDDERDLIQICCKLIEKYTGEEAIVRSRLDRPGHRGVAVSVSSQVLAQLLTSLGGSGARNKQFPGFVFDAPEEFMRGAFEGVLAGDASEPRSEVTSLQQDSERLHWQMRTLAARLQADFAGCYPHQEDGENHAASYRANFAPLDGSPHQRTLSDDEYVYQPVRAVLRAEYDGYVYNIEVEEDHSYVSDFAVHNCDRELISEYAEGIIATTGCPSGEVQTRLRLRQYREALQAASDYRDIFGAENFFLELMDHGLPIERTVREDLLKIGKELGLRPLATNDSHYVTADQAEPHAALLCVQSGKTLNDENRFKFDGSGYYLKSADEMREYWDKEVPGAADNTLLVAEHVEPYEDVWKFQDRMPRVSTEGGQTEREKLEAEIEQFLPTRYPDGITQECRERIDTELDVIDRKGYCAYFLVVGDVTRWAKSQGIHVGPGRGSAAGSLLAYILHITNLDPLEHGLIFERFLNPERDSPPDIDLDFDDRRRDDVLQYAIEKYGRDKVAQVITFGKIKTKAAIKDAARVHHGQPGFAIADKISKALPPPIAAKDIPLAGIVDPQHERYPEAAEVRGLIETDSTVSQIFETARGLEGLIRNAGVHACAVILSSQPLLGTVPLWQRDDGSIITGWDYPSCEAIGLLKMDFLGLSNLTIIGDALEAVRTNHGRDIDLSTLELTDENTYTLLARGDSLGVFQLEGGGMRELLKRLRPTEFTDIVAANALYRPGPMEVNAHLDYADRKNGRKPVQPIHPELDEPLKDILAETYGLIVYQEQIMAIAQRVAGYSLGRADILRRAMGKKKKEVLDQEFEGFRDGMLANNFSDEAIEALWTTVLPFAGYAFNKSHAAGYALVAYWTAYLKANYPAEYMAALLTSNGDNKDKMAVYLGECRRMGVKVLSPDVNDSRDNFTAVGSDIRFGLSAIRNVGSNVVSSIVRMREEHGRYTSFTDFLDKSEPVVCNKRVIESLIKAGAFDSLGHTRMSLAQQHEPAVDAVVGLKRQQALGQFDLFGGDSSGGDTGDSSPLAHLTFTPEEWPRKQLLAYEREMLGLYVSAHPLDGAERLLASYQDTGIAELVGGERENGKDQVKIAGMISGMQRRVNKNGMPWAIVTLEDLDASVEVLFFPKSYEIYADCLVEDTALAVKGRVNEREGTISVVASDAVPVDISAAGTDTGGVDAFVIKVPASKVDRGLVEELKRTLRAHSGTVPVHVKLQSPRGTTRMALSSDFFVSTGNGLQAELKGLLGASCLETS